MTITPDSVATNAIAEAQTPSQTTPAIQACQQLASDIRPANKTLNWYNA